MSNNGMVSIFFSKKSLSVLFEGKLFLCIYKSIKFLKNSQNSQNIIKSNTMKNVGTSYTPYTF